MGKYGIGARVVDGGGDEGVIVEKSKGARRVEYDYEPYGKIWQSKDYLTPLATNDNDAPSISSEVSVSAYSPAEGEETSAWVPKVGDRVRVVDAEGGGVVGDECTVTYVRLPNEDDSDTFCGLDSLTGGYSGLYSYRLKPVVAPATTTTWAPVAGKFGKTRDGRKVGPMRGDWDDEDYPFHTTTGELTGNLWNAAGESYGGKDHHHTLVAEWVEPAPEVAVAEATATEAPWTLSSAKPGDTVRCDDWSGKFFVAGKEYEVSGDRDIRAENGASYSLTSICGSGSFSLVTPAAPPATPPAKFKVGDRVDLYRDGELVETWRNMTITEVDRSDVFEFNTDVGLLCNARELRLSDSLSIGSTVTFIATGRLSAINENGHYQVTFPGLPAGRNSFALPADYVTLAN